MKNKIVIFVSIIIIFLFFIFSVRNTYSYTCCASTDQCAAGLETCSSCGSLSNTCNGPTYNGNCCLSTNPTLIPTTACADYGQQCSGTNGRCCSALVCYANTCVYPTSVPPPINTSVPGVTNPPPPPPGGCAGWCTNAGDTCAAHGLPGANGSCSNGGQCCGTVNNPPPQVCGTTSQPPTQPRISFDYSQNSSSTVIAKLSWIAPGYDSCNVNTPTLRDASTNILWTGTALPDVAGYQSESPTVSNNLPFSLYVENSSPNTANRVSWAELFNPVSYGGTKSTVNGMPPQGGYHLISALDRLGRVTDGGGSGIPNIPLMVTNSSTGRSSPETTDAQGYYQVPYDIFNFPYMTKSTGFNPPDTYGGWFPTDTYTVSSTNANSGLITKGTTVDTTVILTGGNPTWSGQSTGADETAYQPVTCTHPYKNQNDSSSYTPTCFGPELAPGNCGFLGGASYRWVWYFVRWDTNTPPKPEYAWKWGKDNDSPSAPLTGHCDFTLIPYPTVAITGALQEVSGISNTCTLGIASQGLTMTLNPPNGTNGISSTCTLSPGPAVSTAYQCNVTFDNSAYPAVPTGAQLSVGLQGSSGYLGGNFTNPNVCGPFSTTLTITKDSGVVNKDIGLVGGAWYKLRRASLHKYGDYNNAPPINWNVFDTDDFNKVSGGQVLNEGNSGLTTTSGVANVGSAWGLKPIPISTHQWLKESYTNVIDYDPTTFMQYVQARKAFKTAPLLSSINTTHDIWLINPGDVTVNTQFNTFISSAAWASTDALLIIVQGNLNVDVSTFNSGLYPIAFIVTGTINFTSNAVIANGIFIGNNVTIADRSPSDDSGFKISGNLISQTPFVQNRKRTDNTKPTFFLFFQPGMYNQLLPYLSIATYDWRQTE